METSHESTGETLFDLTSYAAVIHANPSPPLDTDAAPTTTGIYGPTSTTPLATYDPVTRSWKMYEGTCLWDSIPFSETSPASGTTQNGTLYALPLLEVLIVENGSSLWPTPTTHGENTQTRVEAQRRRMEAGLEYSTRLTQAIALRYPDDHGYLSPAWTELLMGFPPGWTDLEP